MNNKSIRGVAVLGLVAAFLGACGGTDGAGKPSPSSLEPEQCPAVPSPCGGELVGEWEVIDACSTLAPTNPAAECANALLTLISVDVEGEQSFLADGTTVSSGSVEQTMRFDMPLNCLARPCTELADSFRRDFEDEYEVLDVRCEEQSEMCVCAATIRQTLLSSQETYTVEDTRITTIDAEGEVDVEDYCVEGDRATFVSDELIVVLQRR